MSVLIKSTRWCSQLLRLEAAAAAAALVAAERRATDLQGGFSSRAAATECNVLACLGFSLLTLTLM